MKYWKISSVLLVFLFIGIPYPTFAQSATFTQTAIQASSPPILKINQYYILFTYPYPPFIDSQNRVLVPLRSLSDLLGAKVSYDTEKKQANIQLNGHTVIVTANSKDIVVDQTTNQMDTVPVLKLNALFVPLRVMIDDVGVHGTYQSATQTIELNDPKYMKYTPGLTQETWDRRNVVEDQNAFAVTSYQVNIRASSKDGTWDGNITYKAKNITDHIIEQGKEDVHDAVMWVNGSNYSTTSYTIDVKKHKAVNPGESITRTRRVNGLNLPKGLGGNGDLGYFIVKPYAVK
ncbi:copper amine oxidase N-terminal domain-containing protein [Paenibacillus hunanensis]|uniref:copper amine oxidase N-terminal domain-containing protein n=1 Tax=Paenibacillus hunanensis TaxID=539262 RepID=UPI002A6AF91A|nr:copper amine oxidase N-terminal domain-containing protein [Paenibacillus hunanensis]WPP40156.1 copper amine oxidase N-terminal domain-containing protein [Paenibacillus hunanensis]